MQSATENSQSSSNHDSDLPLSDTQLGHNMKQFYILNADYINTNNGSFGICPRYVIKAKERYMDQLEARPDFFLSYNHPRLYEESRQLLGKFLNADPADLVFVKNATEGANTVLQSLHYEPGDIILLFDITYNAVHTLCKTLVDKFGVVIVVVETTEEALNSKEVFLQIVQSYVEKHGQKIKIALIDHISSCPAIIFPVKELVKLFRENKILCMVDGAHAIVQTEVDLKEMDPDYYYSNLHKWSPIPQSIAVLYVKKELQSTTHPAILSRAYKKGYVDEFIRMGTRDCSNIYCVKEAMQFLESVGIKRWREYCHGLAMQVGKRVSEIWKTNMLVSNEEMIPFMVNVVLPYQGEDTYQKLDWEEVFKKTKATLIVAKYKEVYYVRFSCTVVNEIKDFEDLARSVLEFLGLKH